MDCLEVKKHSNPYIDGEIEDSQASLIGSHVTSCPICKTEFRGLKRTISALKSLPEVEIPHNFLVRINDKIDAPSHIILKIKEFFASQRFRYAFAFTMSVLILSVAVFKHYNEGFGIQPEAELAMADMSAVPPEKTPVITEKFKPPAKPPVTLVGRTVGEVIAPPSTSPLYVSRVKPVFTTPKPVSSMGGSGKGMVKIYTVPKNPGGFIAKMPDIVMAIMGSKASRITPDIITLVNLGGGKIISYNSNIINIAMPTSKVHWMITNLEEFGDIESTQGIGEGPTGKWALMQIILIPTR